MNQRKGASGIDSFERLLPRFIFSRSPYVWLELFELGVQLSPRQLLRTKLIPKRCLIVAMIVERRNSRLEIEAPFASTNTTPIPPDRLVQQQMSMTGTRQEQYVDLDRTFHELSKQAQENDEADISRHFSAGSRLHWDDLLKEYRVVILSEAGSGKTAEIRNKAIQLRRDGKAAFFLRLEHISDGFEDAFEVGILEEFEAWCDSPEEGWLLLDSVDEARLRHPGDFERAIRMLARRIGPAKERAHIVITGRTFAWRPKTDLALCAIQLPFTQPVIRQVESQVDDFSDREHTPANLRTKEILEARIASAFKVVALDDLSRYQVEVFAKARGVEDTDLLLDAIERADASSHTARPQDLAELVDFWLDQRKIGTRLELMRSSIDRRLTERDQSRADARPISAERLRDGARTLAAATALAKMAVIRVPDGAENKEGIPAGDVLPDWNEQELSALLSRPIFDEAIYGAVRFHHRSVREYLAAEWFAELLERDTSRRKIEELFFRNQYGTDVVTPTLRPVLPWLAILDQRIRDKLERIAPEVFFEGGDPSQLPLETRRRILRDVCEKLASGSSDRSMADYSAVQRFAGSDITNDVRELFGKYKDNDDLRSFLLRMVWLGQLSDALPDAKAVALSLLASRYTRIAALRAVAAIGSSADMMDIRQSFSAESEELSRDWLAELLGEAEPSDDSLTWLLECLAKVPTKERYSVDNLAQAVESFVERLAIASLPMLLTGVNRLLSQQPVVERQFCEISQRFSWLLKSAALAVTRLVEARHEFALEAIALDTMRRIRMSRYFSDIDLKDTDRNLQELVAGWPDLNRGLFWHSVVASREGLDKKKSERLIDYWQAGAWDSFWRFEAGDFDYIVDQIESQPFQDDKLVALSLAYVIYRDAGRPRAWRERLRRIVSGNEELTDKLHQFLNPPANANAKRWKQQERQWKKRDEERQRRQDDNKEKWRQHLAANIEKIRDPGFPDPTDVSQHQWYLHEQVRREDETHTRWTTGNWQALVPYYGEPVARAFRDATVAHWRKADPVLRSEGAEENKTTAAVIFGLTGLAIESTETEQWIDNLSPADVLRACRYASLELNGFPQWLPEMFESYPDIVGEFLLAEVEFELAVETEEKNLHYMLSDLSWSGQWAWPWLGPRVATILNERDVLNVENLDRLLTILQGSQVTDSEISALAAAKVQALTSVGILTRWYAAWVGVAPDMAIPALQARFDQLPIEDKTSFAMQFVTNLIGGRRGQTNGARKAFETADHLKTLFLMMHTYISRSDDIERAGTGVYSPELRDDAQDSRNSLFERLNSIPGKAAYLALLEVANSHPDQASRPWMRHWAQLKAQQDSDFAGWSPSQVRDFHKMLERTPANHRELAELALLRLHDLKDDLENGDNSLADIVVKGATLETEMRRYIGKELRDKAQGRYHVPQEEELADAKKPDLRFLGVGFDGPVPLELKLADNWSGPDLFERMENQLCGDYLRDKRSSRGLFVLVYRGEKVSWELPDAVGRVDFDGIVDALQQGWAAISGRYTGVEDITILGIDLTKRGR